MSETKQESLPQQMWAQFHKLWTKDVGTPGYVKKDWLKLEELILKVLEKAKAPAHPASGPLPLQDLANSPNPIMTQMTEPIFLSMPFWLAAIILFYICISQQS